MTMKYLDPIHRLFPYRRHVLAVAFILPGLSLIGCKAFDAMQPQIQAGLTDVVTAANGVKTVVGAVPIPPATTLADIASLIASIAGGILVVDRAIEKSRTPVTVTPVPSTPPTTPKA